MTIVLRVHECMNTFFKSADNQYENTTDPPNDDWWLFLVVFQGGLHRSKWTFLNRFCMKVVVEFNVDIMMTVSGSTCTAIHWKFARLL